MITRAVILAGGRGTRLAPATKVTNKHLLPVYDRPMIFYPLETLQKMGIKQVLIVCGTEHAGDFAKLLGTGKDFDMRLTYAIQEGEGGIADALSLAEDFSAKESVAVILGDNIFSDDFSSEAADFSSGAILFAKEVPDPERFGVVEMTDLGEILSLEEKPTSPKSSLASTGLYFFDATVFEKIKNITPSARGELEIVDVQNLYHQEGSLRAKACLGEWTDAGTPESLFRATELARSMFHAR